MLTKHTQSAVVNSDAHFIFTSEAYPLCLICKDLYIRAGNLFNTNTLNKYKRCLFKPKYKKRILETRGREKILYL